MSMNKFVVDGPNKLFIEKSGLIDGDGITTIDVKVDLYSAWKKHIQGHADVKYGEAVRTVGGDTLTAGKTLGDTYFLVNGWRLRPYEADHKLALQGNLFTEEGGSVVVSTTGSYNVLAEMFVSNLTDATATVADFEVERLQHLIESQRPTHSAFGNIYYWDFEGGSDSADGLTPDAACKTWSYIHDNLLKDGNHDVVFVLAHNPDSVVDITEQIVIDKSAVFVRGPGFHIRVKSNDQSAIVVNGDIVEIDSLRIDAQGTGNAIEINGHTTKISEVWIDDAYNGIHINQGLNHKIIHNRIEHCRNIGCCIKDVDSALLHDNIITRGSGWGVSFCDGVATQNVFDANLITHNSGGIYIGTTTDGTIIRDSNYISNGIINSGVETHNQVQENIAVDINTMLNLESDGVTWETIMSDVRSMARGKIVESSSGVFNFYDTAGTGILYTLTKTGNQRVPS